MKQINKVKGFTLVELIVVITILAILGTIAFISLQGYSAQARDTTRITDIQNIKKSLELFSLNTGKYPLPDDGEEVLYDTELMWIQGTAGNTVTTNLSRNLNEKPTDPLTETEYTYSVINSQTKYELLSIYESDLISYLPHPNPLLIGEGTRPNLVSGVNAANANYPKISGNYNGVFVKTATYYVPLPSIITSADLSSGLTLTDGDVAEQIITGGENNIAYGQSDAKINGLPNFIISSYSGTITKKSLDTDKQNLAQVLINAYTGTILANAGIYEQIANTDLTDTGALTLLVDDVVLSSGTYVSSSGGGDQTPPAPIALITQTTCESADWIWVLPENDVYIGSTQSTTGFCISPRFGDWNNDSATGNGGISWNGWGNYVGDIYNGWDASSIDDDSNSYPEYGQTRKLDSEVSYDCKALGTSSTDFDTTDNIVGRMKWIATTGNTYDNARNIEWITGLVPHTVGTNPHAIPALYVADCIDGVKNLGETMTYIHNDNIPDEITYAEYNNNVSSSDVDVANLTDPTYQNRQKYLTAWTQQSGSHLPSAFSYINDNTAGGQYLDVGNGWDKYTDDDAKGEYQVACEVGFTSVDTTPQNEWIWLSAVGNTTGTFWGRDARTTGYHACGNQQNDISRRSSNKSARFVVRP